jgi:hypothetical protein
MKAEALGDCEDRNTERTISTLRELGIPFRISEKPSGQESETRQRTGCERHLVGEFEGLLADGYGSKLYRLELDPKRHGYLSIAISPIENLVFSVRVTSFSRGGFLIEGEEVTVGTGSEGPAHYKVAIRGRITVRVAIPRKTLRSTLTLTNLSDKEVAFTSQLEFVDVQISEEIGRYSALARTTIKQAKKIANSH